MRRKVIEDVKGKIMWFNYILSFTIFILLSLIILFSYQQWDFITKPLVMGMLSVTAVLILKGLFLSHQISKQVVRTMDNYHNNLKCLLNLSFAMTGENHEDALLEKILKYATALVDAKAAYILLIDKNMLYVKMAVGLDSKKVMGVSIHKTSGAFAPEDAESIFYFANQAAQAINIATFYENQKNLEIHLTGVLLDAIDNTFPEKRGHSVRVAKYALSIARAVNMPEEEQKELYRACLLHDIGFLKLNPKDILSMDKYKLHPQLAYEILRVIDFYADIAPIVLQHHERYNGQGYPSKLKGEDIQPESRIIAIAEAFDAMVSKDSYKSFTYDFETAIEKLKDNE